MGGELLKLRLKKKKKKEDWKSLCLKRLEMGKAQCGQNGERELERELRRVSKNSGPRLKSAKVRKMHAQNTASLAYTFGSMSLDIKL